MQKKRGGTLNHQDLYWARGIQPDQGIHHDSTSNHWIIHHQWINGSMDLPPIIQHDFKKKAIWIIWVYKSSSLGRLEKKHHFSVVESQGYGFPLESRQGKLGKA